MFYSQLAKLAEQRDTCSDNDASTRNSSGNAGAGSSILQATPSSTSPLSQLSPLTSTPPPGLQSKLKSPTAPLVPATPPIFRAPPPSSNLMPSPTGKSLSTPISPPTTNQFTAPPASPAPPPGLQSKLTPISPPTTNQFTMPPASPAPPPGLQSKLKSPSAPLAPASPPKFTASPPTSNLMPSISSPTTNQFTATAPTTPLPLQPKSPSLSSQLTTSLSTEKPAPLLVQPKSATANGWITVHRHGITVHQGGIKIPRASALPAGRHESNAKITASVPRKLAEPMKKGSTATSAGIPTPLVRAYTVELHNYKHFPELPKSVRFLYLLANVCCCYIILCTLSLDVYVSNYMCTEQSGQCYARPLPSPTSRSPTAIVETSTVSSVSSDYGNLVVGEGTGIEGGNNTTHGNDSCATNTTADISSLESPCDNGSDNGDDSDGSDSCNDDDNTDTSSIELKTPTKSASKKRNFRRIPGYGTSSRNKQLSPSTATPSSSVMPIPHAVSDAVRQKQQAPQTRTRRRLNPLQTSSSHCQWQQQPETVTSGEDSESSTLFNASFNNNSPLCQKRAQRATRKRAHRRARRADLASSCELRGFEFNYSMPSPPSSPPIKRVRTANRKALSRKRYNATKRQRDASGSVATPAAPQEGARTVIATSVCIAIAILFYLTGHLLIVNHLTKGVDLPVKAVLKASHLFLTLHRPSGRQTPTYSTTNAHPSQLPRILSGCFAAHR